MGTVPKIVGGMAVVFVTFLATLRALDTLGTSCPAGERFELTRPFPPASPPSSGGRSFANSVPALESFADSMTGPNRSPVIVCEGNIPLGPEHALHSDIAAKGAGRFSHWGPYVIFSSSDGSDPNANGRSYVVVKPR
jgi:hypothetical protein